MAFPSARLALLLSLVTAPVAALACPPPDAPSFMENLRGASNVYVFRLMSLEVTDGQPWYSTLNGRINVVRTLKGSTPKASRLAYSIDCCAPRLMVGRYYLAAVSNDAATLQLVRGDQSIIDVSDDFTDKGGAGETGAITPVQGYLSGRPLPADFPGDYRLEATVTCPVAPPPR